MPFNYFDVFAGADKEMMHSAMLRYFLLMHPVLAGRLFPHFPYAVARVELEKGYAKGKKRFRMDVEAWSEEDAHLLLIENKFKAFPILGQLQDYDALYRRLKKNPVCYLVCFDGSGVPFQEKGVIHTKHCTWHILTYREIWSGIETYLEESPPLDPEQRVFLSHYARYLAAYYAKYDAICGNYKEAFAAPDAPGEESSREAVQESRFWQRLVLSAVGNGFTAKRREQGVRANECGSDYGGSTVPLLIVFPAHWSDYDAFEDGPGKKRPVLCLQMQGDSLKLGLDRLPKNAEDSVRAEILAYAKTLLGALSPDAQADIAVTADVTLKARMERGNRYITLCRRHIDKNVPATGLGEQLWRFFQDMDGAVARAGNLPGRPAG